MWWRVHYDDGSSYSNEDGSPWDAPRLGVVVIAVENDQVGWLPIHGEDYYYWEEDRDGWNATDILGMRDHLERAHRPLVLFGRQVKLSEYRATLSKVKKLYGTKYGYTNEEKRGRRCA